jgi:hypothetical protein
MKIFFISGFFHFTPACAPAMLVSTEKHTLHRQMEPNMTFKATEAELKARLAQLNNRKADLKAEKVTFDAALKRAKSDCEYNSTMRKWNQDDIKAAKDELKAAKAAEKARKAEAKANKPKRKTKAQREQEAADRFYANERHNDEARAKAEEQRKADEAADAAWREYQEQVRRVREQNEAARRVREEAERVRANAPKVTKDQVRAELFADFGLLYGMNAAQIRQVRMAYAKANLAGALGQGSHEKLAYANAILDEMDPVKAAKASEMNADNMNRAREARAAYNSRRGFW